MGIRHGYTLQKLAAQWERQCSLKYNVSSEFREGKLSKAKEEGKDSWGRLSGWCSSQASLEEE